MTNRFTISGYQEQGGRSYQEDRYYSDSMVLGGTKVFVLAIADGMGGHKAGDIASELAIKEVRKFFSNFEITDFQNLKAQLYDVFSNANHAILNHSKIDPAAAGLGTTLTCAVIMNQQMIVAHIGDSRAFLVNDSSIFQCTKDHTAYQEALDSGVDVSKINVGANALTRCLDGGNDYEPDLSSVYNVEQALVFLCSDGLYNAVPVHDLENIARESADSNVFSRRAVKQAVENGAGDNVSVVTFADSERTIFPVGTLTASKKKQILSVTKSVVLVLFLMGIAISGFGLYSYVGVGDENGQNTEISSNGDGSGDAEPMDDSENEDSLQITGSDQFNNVNIKNDAVDGVEAEVVDVTFDLHPPDAEVDIENRGTSQDNEEALQTVRDGLISLQAGSYVAYMSREGYRSDNEDFEVDYPESEGIVISFKLQKMQGNIDLILVPENADANISILNDETGKTLDLESDTLLSPIPLSPGDYMVTVTSELYETVDTTFTIADRETTELNIELLRNDSPVPGAKNIPDKHNPDLNSELQKEETTDGDEETNIDDTVVPKEPAHNEELPYYVSLFSSDKKSERAENYRDEIKSSIGKYASQIQIIKVDSLWRLMIGPYDSEESADTAKNELENILQDRIEKDERLRPWKIQHKVNQ